MRWIAPRSAASLRLRFCEPGPPLLLPPEPHPQQTLRFLDLTLSLLGFRGSRLLRFLVQCVFASYSCLSLACFAELYVRFSVALALSCIALVASVLVVSLRSWFFLSVSSFWDCPHWPSTARPLITHAFTWTLYRPPFRHSFAHLTVMELDVLHSSCITLPMYTPSYRQ